MPTTLYLVRHGETTYNVENRLQGWCDSSLTPEGVADVQATAVRLADRQFVAAYSSPSERALLTSTHLLARHLTTPLREESGLREFGFGDHEGRHESELLLDGDPFEMFAAIVSGTFAGFPEGEQGPAYRQRVLQAFRAIETAHPDGEVLVVSHCLTMLVYLTSIDHRLMIPPRNAGVVVVEVDRRRRVVEAGLLPAGSTRPTPARR